MSASYELRLLLQCLSSFFFAHLLFSCVLLLFAPLSLRWAERASPAIGVRLLLVFRFFPLVAALYLTLAISLPSYLRLEPEIETERVGLLGLCCASLAVCVWIRPFVRTMRALWKSFKFLQRMQRAAEPLTISSTAVWLIRDCSPRLAVAGLMRTRLLLSESTIRILTPEELKVVLAHEKAHQQSRDNLKRLLFLVLPDALPFLGFAGKLEGGCKRLVEWAADDRACAGDSRNSVALARALVCFARNSGCGPGCTLATSLIDDTSDLARRVERLLVRPSSQRVSQVYLAVCLALCSAAAIVAGILPFAGLSNVHRVLEILSR